MWWAWELSESRKCVMEVVVVVVVHYGALCLESFSASVGDDPPLPMLSQLAQPQAWGLQLKELTQLESWTLMERQPPPPFIGQRH